MSCYAIFENRSPAHHFRPTFNYTPLISSHRIYISDCFLHKKNRSKRFQSKTRKHIFNHLKTTRILLFVVLGAVGEQLVFMEVFTFSMFVIWMLFYLIFTGMATHGGTFKNVLKRNYKV